MNNQEAIELLQELMYEWESLDAEHCLDKYRDSINTAIAALEQSGKDKSCACNICGADEINKLLIMKHGNVEYLAFVGGISKFPKENHSPFCPKCGRKLEWEEYYDRGRAGIRHS